MKTYKVTIKPSFGSVHYFKTKASSPLVAIRRAIGDISYFSFETKYEISVEQI